MKLPLEKDKILKELQDQIKLGKDFIEPKVEIWLNNLDKYVDQNKDDEKVGVNTLYSTSQLYTALRVSDEISVIAKGRNFGDELYADNITSLAEFDFEELNMRQIRHAQSLDHCLFGVSIITKDGWDEYASVVKVKVQDPMSWIPDPYCDYLHEGRWNLFESKISLRDLKNSTSNFNEDEIDTAIMSEVQRIDTYRNRAYAFNDIDDQTLDKMVSIYSGYSRIDGKLYAVAIDGNMSSLLKFEEIKPITEEEQKTGFVSMKTCVCLSWLSPVRGNPTGISMADLVLDKQKAVSQLLNLRLIDAKFSTFGQMNLVNTSIVNPIDLKNPSTNTKFIPVKADGQSLSNAIYPVPRQSIIADSYNVSQELSRQTQLDTGMDSRTLGIQGDKSITLGEAQQIQTNANVILGLGIEVTNWADYDFWNFIWYRSYREFFSNEDQKFVRVTNGFNTNPATFRRDDIIGCTNIDFVIESKKKSQQIREQLKISFASTLPMILNDPNVPKITKSMAFRYYLKLQGHERDMQSILNPYFSIEEVDARRKVMLLNMDDENGATIDSFDVELMTYYIIYQTAMDTPAKHKALWRLEEAMIYTGQNRMKEQNSSMEGMVNASASQMTSNMLQSGGKNQQSLQTI